MNITGGKYKGQKISAPDEKITRPTLSKVRMAVFNTLQSIIDFEEKSFFDMYAGSGIMGLEALSRGFGELLACEKNKEVYRILKNNFSKYEKENDIKLILGDSMKIAAKIDKVYDVIYIDPPYFSEVYEQSLDAVKGKGGIIILEHVADVDMSGFKLIKQKQYGDKFVSFITL
ncbi:16S rRNA (guanine(966)-N(2))-methyltransferase RsmD [bacterium]|nr:16S rRNA (guanine(966)-N(2))-methyltransferase RsmD [bacterium]